MSYASVLEDGQWEIARARGLRHRGVVAAARRRCRPIRGGSDGLEHGARRATITAKLASGALPRLAPSAMWAGKGHGTNVCAGCDELIEPGAVEYEPEFADHTTRRLRHACLALWCEQRARA
jgi:hypothetical protein